MSRLTVNFPFVWNSLSGQQPASNLDADNNAISPSGTITIGTKVKAGSYTLIADDEYSFILCVPTANMTLNLANVAATNYSFFFSNQSTTTNRTVQLLASVTVDGTPTLNPSFTSGPGARGGLVWFDGSTWSMSSKPFFV